MADFATIRAKINHGFGKGGTITGVPIEWYRPNGVNDPISPWNMMGSLVGQLDPAPTFPLTKPSEQRQPRWFGLLDPTQMQQWDYLVAPAFFSGTPGTWFIASIEPLRPALCILCNHTLQLWRLLPQTVVGGTATYGGTTRAADGTQLANGWPASLLMLGSKVEIGPVKLPADARLPWVEVNVPSIGDLVFMFNDRLMDENGREYAVATAEQTPLGWRLTAQVLDN